MNVRARTVSILLGVSVAAMGTALAQQEPGMVGSGPPEDIFLEFSLAEDGAVALTPSQFNLAWGGYYRFNFVCPEGLADGEGVVFYAPELWENSHIRIISVADTTKPEEDPQVNFYMQGRLIGKLECEGLAMTARVSFHPMRRGTYDFTVVNERTDPFTEVVGQFIVE